MQFISSLFVKVKTNGSLRDICLLLLLQDFYFLVLLWKVIHCCAVQACSCFSGDFARPPLMNLSGNCRTGHPFIYLFHCVSPTPFCFLFFPQRLERSFNNTRYFFSLKTFPFPPPRLNRICQLPTCPLWLLNLVSVSWLFKPFQHLFSDSSSHSFILRRLLKQKIPHFLLFAQCPSSLGLPSNTYRFHRERLRFRLNRRPGSPDGNRQRERERE